MEGTVGTAGRGVFYHLDKKLTITLLAPVLREVLPRSAPPSRTGRDALGRFSDVGVANRSARRSLPPKRQRKTPQPPNQRKRPKMLAARSALALPGAGWAQPARSISSVVVRSAAPAAVARASPSCGHGNCTRPACALTPRRPLSAVVARP